MRKKIPISLSPSIRAASIISCGKDLALCRNIMIRNGVDNDGSITAVIVLVSFMVENIRNSGIMIAANGIIIAISRIVITISLPLS